MASHIATEEWQSFELRMRRRRAERMLVHAEAALDAGRVDEATAALDEARHLCPALPLLADVEARIARAVAPPLRAPIGPRVRRAATIAAGIAIVAVAGVFGSRAWRAQPPASATSAGAEAITAPAPPPATAARPSIRIDTEKVPPVVIAGPSPDVPQQPAAPAAFLQAAADTVTTPAAPAAPPSLDRSISAPPRDEADARPAATTGSVAATPSEPPVSPSTDVGAIAALGKETTMPSPAPAPAPERVSRGTYLPSIPDRPEPIVRRTEPPPPPVSVPKTPDDETLVRGILDRYAEAYTRLDADAAKAVWPSVNRAALSRAFDGLTEQRVAFSDCSVDVRNTQARATCSGATTWEPKIGGGARTDAHRWAFNLEKSGNGWVIRDARVQNR
jgi:hypothetical protein